MPDRNRRLGTTAATGLAVSAVLVACTPTTGTPPPATTPSPITNSERGAVPPDAGRDYADGQYAAEGQYGSLPSSIGVSITLAQDVITAVDVTPHATDPTSLDLQNRFADAVPTVVIGRDIDEISIDRLAGSSHTTEGFRAALEEIKAEARTNSDVRTRQEQERSQGIEDEIRALSLEKFRWKTEGHFDQLADLFDDEMVFVHLTGRITTKEEWMNQLRSGSFVYNRIDPEEASVRAYGDTAVLVGKARFEVNGGSVYPLVYTEVFTKKNNEWKLVNLHTTSGS